MNQDFDNASKRNSTTRAAELIDHLDLQPHPEGEHFSEVFRSNRRVIDSDRSLERSAMTTIYFLLSTGDFSRWHVVDSDEIWHFYEGDSLRLLTVDPSEMIIRQRLLGINDDKNEQVVVVPQGHWQTALPLGKFALCGCTVGPGFEFSDMHFLKDGPEGSVLRKRFPDVASFL
jgi:predicted cupin superfamily sugar epimerase